MNDDVFWVIWNPAMSYPKVMHKTYEEAKEEAKRLCSKEGVPIYVLRCCGFARLSSVQFTEVY